MTFEVKNEKKYHDREWLKEQLSTDKTYAEIVISSYMEDHPEATEDEIEAYKSTLENDVSNMIYYIKKYELGQRKRGGKVKYKTEEERTAAKVENAKRWNEKNAERYKDKTQIVVGPIEKSQRDIIDDLRGDKSYAAFVIETMKEVYPKSGL